RKILLLVDNATSHAIDNSEEYPNICLHFLPANTTAHLQPMDADIINAFKAHYKCLYIHQVINDFDEGVKEPEKINVLQAMRLVKSTWDEIKVELAANEDLAIQEVHISEIVTAQ
ncbi:9520_t:CDS:2, partial [Cetraspora pellucida]